MNELDGTRIVVTRPTDRADGLVRALQDAGAYAVRCPTIRIAPPESWSDLDAALERLDDYRWLVFTSRSGVQSVMARLPFVGLSADDLRGDRVAAVGYRTARALGSYGVRPALVPQAASGQALVDALDRLRGEQILLARADIADPALPHALLERGAGRVDDVVVYRTLPVAPAARALRELRRGVDGITFTSPSTLHGFMSMGPQWRDLLTGVAVVTIGPATSRAVRSEGLEVAAEAGERSMKGLVDALGLVLGPTGERSEERAHE